MFHDTRMEGSIGCEGNKIWLPFAEGVANFGHRGERFAFLIETEINRDRIKDISKHPRQGEELDAANRFTNPLRLKITADILPGRG